MEHGRKVQGYINNCLHWKNKSYIKYAVLFFVTNIQESRGNARSKIVITKTRFPVQRAIFSLSKLKSCLASKEYIKLNTWFVFHYKKYENNCNYRIRT